MVTETPRRWPNNYKGLPARMGTLPAVEKFDNNYFNVSAKQVSVLAFYLIKFYWVNLGEI